MSVPIARPGSGRHGARTTLAGGLRQRRWHRKLLLFAGLGLAGVLIGAAGLLARGAFPAPMITVHGTEQVVVTSFDGMSITGAFPDITGGTPVIVVNGSGAVIARGALAASDPSSWGPQDAVYAFSVSVPGGESRYGIQIGRNRGTAWFSQRQMRAGPALFLSG
jgi:hypothetical protein